jgi:hypothetical protein
MFEHLVALRLRAKFDGLSDSELRERVGGGGVIPRQYSVHGLSDLMRLVGPLFVATQLDEICRHSTSRPGRFAACTVTGRDFPGRCTAYGYARESIVEGIEDRFVARAFDSCQAASPHLINDIRSIVSRGDAYGASVRPKKVRETLRVYASAMDAEVHLAACEVAAKTLEAHDIPECSIR